MPIAIVSAAMNVKPRFAANVRNAKRTSWRSASSPIGSAVHPRALVRELLALLAHLREVPEPLHRRLPCLGLAHPGASELLHSHLDVKRELLVHVAGGVGAPEATVAAREGLGSMAVERVRGAGR